MVLEGMSCNFHGGGARAIVVSNPAGDGSISIPLGRMTKSGLLRPASVSW